jgi:hypothetical protein
MQSDNNDFSSGRSIYRRSRTLKDSKPKGFLKIAREKVRRETDILYSTGIDSNTTIYGSNNPCVGHVRSHSSDFFQGISSPCLTPTLSPTIEYIRQPTGDF